MCQCGGLLSSLNPVGKPQIIPLLHQNSVLSDLAVSLFFRTYLPLTSRLFLSWCMGRIKVTFNMKRQKCLLVC